MLSHCPYQLHKIPKFSNPLREWVISTFDYQIIQTKSKFLTQTFSIICVTLKKGPPPVKRRCVGMKTL